MDFWSISNPKKGPDHEDELLLSRNYCVLHVTLPAATRVTNIKIMTKL